MNEQAPQYNLLTTQGKEVLPGYEALLNIAPIPDGNY
jgi:hypothetical protein